MDSQATEDDAEEESSLPDLEEIPAEVRTRRRDNVSASGARSAASVTCALPTWNTATASLRQATGLVAGIAVPEWESLERVAMEEALEQEETLQHKQ